MVPDNNGVKTPEALPMVATVVFVLLHVPPEKELVKVVVVPVPAHETAEPPIADGD